MNKLDLEETTRRFHNVYEQVAKEYGYKTREDTKELDFNSPNGMTMLKTVETITTPYLEEIERLTKKVEDSQLAYLQVDKDKQRLKNELIEEKKAYIRMYNQWVDEKEKIFIALEFIIHHMGYYSSRLSQSEEMYVNDLNKLVSILKGKR